MGARGARYLSGRLGVRSNTSSSSRTGTARTVGTLARKRTLRADSDDLGIVRNRKFPDFYS